MKTPEETVRFLTAGGATGYSAIDAAIEREDIRLEDVEELMLLAINAYREQDRVEVQLWNAEHDGVRVVQIDTHENDGRIRVNLNDAPIWDGDPTTDRRPGAHFDWWPEMPPLELRPDELGPDHLLFMHEAFASADTEGVKIEWTTSLTRTTLSCEVLFPDGPRRRVETVDLRPMMQEWANRIINKHAKESI